jgi:hypothetical protein
MARLRPDWHYHQLAAAAPDASTERGGYNNRRDEPLRASSGRYSERLDAAKRLQLRVRVNPGGFFPKLFLMPC